jgi:hypothetical protein
MEGLARGSASNRRSPGLGLARGCCENCEQCNANGEQYKMCEREKGKGIA